MESISLDCGRFFTGSHYNEDMNKNLFSVHFFVASMLCCSVIVTPTYAAKQKTSNKYEDQYLSLRASARNSEQLDAFYTGRGFSRDAINEIKKTCFLTLQVKNKIYDVLWMILDDWAFFDKHGKKIKRITRNEWKGIWNSIGLKQAHQSTFGWTQLPESRDLRSDEHVAGNIALPWQSGPIKLVAMFRTGLDKAGEPRVIVLENFQCIK